MSGTVTASSETKTCHTKLFTDKCFGDFYFNITGESYKRFRAGRFSPPVRGLIIVNIHVDYKYIKLDFCTLEVIFYHETGINNISVEALLSKL